MINKALIWVMAAFTSKMVSTSNKIQVYVGVRVTLFFPYNEQKWSAQLIRYPLIIMRRVKFSVISLIIRGWYW